VSKSNWVAMWLEDFDATPDGNIDPSGFGPQDTKAGWYVNIREVRTNRCIPLRFGRQVDAEKSAATLNANIPATTIKRAEIQVTKLGLKNLRELMTKDLAW
jgi:hypothetical protein